MSVEIVVEKNCQNCELFKNLKNQKVSIKTTRYAAAEAWLDLWDSGERSFQTMANKISDSPLGQRSCSANEIAHGITECDRPNEFTPKESLVDKS